MTYILIKNLYKQRGFFMKLFDKFKNSYLVNTLSTVYENLKFAYWENLLFEAIYKILSICLFIPFVSLIFNKLISLSGFNSLTNSEILRFALSKYGLLSLLVLSPIMMIFIFLEFSVLIIISYFSNKKKKINLISALKKSFFNIKPLFAVGALQMGLYLILLVPLFNFGASSSVLPSLSIPRFVSGELRKTFVGTLLYFGLIILILYFNIRWIYSIHVILLEGAKSFKVAAKRSSQIVKKNYLKTLLMLILSILIFLISFIILAFILVFIACFFIWIFNKDLSHKLAPTIVFIICLSLYYLLMTITTPIIINTLTKLYLDHCDKENICIDNITFTEKDKKQSFVVKHKSLILSLFIFPAILIMLTVSIVVDSQIIFLINDKLNTFDVMAHRGYIKYGVENTIESIDAAINSNADYAEIDLLQSKDGNIVVIHDNNLKRLAKENLNVSDLTLSELKNIKLYQDNFEGEISTLDEVLKYSKGKIKLNLELKLHGNEKDFIEKFLSILDKNDFYDECIVQSTNYDILKEVKSKCPKLKIGYIVLTGFPKVEFLDVDFLSVEESVVNKKLILASKLLNKDIYVWTANDSTSIQEYYYMGVDGVITDEVDIAKSSIKSIKEESLISELYDLINSNLKLKNL